MRFKLLIIAAIASLGLMSSSRGDDSVEKVYLPRPAETVLGVRIGWYINDLVGALKAAQSQNQMLVIIFRADLCAWCTLQLAHELRCEAFNELGGHAVFALIDPRYDGQNEDAWHLATNLGIDSYPTLSVLDIKGTNVEERIRRIGYEPLPAMVSGLRDALKLGNGPLYTGPKPKPATEIYYGEPKPDCADGAEKRVSAPYSTPVYRP